MHCGPRVTVNVIAQHALADSAALIIRPRVAVPALAEVPLDAELRVLEQVFVDRMLARNRARAGRARSPVSGSPWKTISTRGPGSTLNDQVDGRSSSVESRELRGRRLVVALLRAARRRTGRAADRARRRRSRRRPAGRARSSSGGHRFARRPLHVDLRRCAHARPAWMANHHRRVGRIAPGVGAHGDLGLRIARDRDKASAGSRHLVRRARVTATSHGAR